jgi:hypothetical protein
MEDIKLEFIGPYKFFGKENIVFKNELKYLPGIYLWTFKTNKGYLIHYIGQTERFAIRQKQHLISILGLDYGIFDAVEAIDGKQKIIWNGLWRDKGYKLFEKEIKNVYLHETSKVIEYIESIDIFFADFDEKKQIRKYIEGLIGLNLRNKHKEYKTLFPDDIRFELSSNKLNCKLKIINKFNILGLDNEIEI